MNKQEFLDRLKKGLSGLPEDDIEERLYFYREMIDDRIEEGLSEEEAVAELGSVDELVAQTVAETPITRLVKERIRPGRRLGAVEIVLLVLGSPIWLSLLLAVGAVTVSVYAALWSVIVSLWAVFAALSASALACAAAGVYYAVSAGAAAVVLGVSAGAAAAGLAIFMFFICKAATKGTVYLTKAFAVWIKRCFIKKEVA